MNMFRALIVICLVASAVSDEVIITLASGETQTVNAYPGTYTNFKFVVDSAVPGRYVVDLGGVRNECTSAGTGCTMTWTGSLWLPASMTNSGILPVTGSLLFEVDVRARSIAWIIGVTTVLGVLGLACLCVAVIRRMSSRSEEVTSGIIITSPPQQCYGTPMPHVEGVPVSASGQDSFTTVQISRN
eukprot:TRINITY_DN15768_c0_g1_i1.p1 TRINITY_DN15768_c0_g1~~TRINITY_DN15768_c0_g1_i1.p1  ORF type:complete len:203 (+),score=27.09 TRINITY_DN15768_c0_g1_i1:53-610(+)